MNKTDEDGWAVSANAKVLGVIEDLERLQNHVVIGTRLSAQQAAKLMDAKHALKQLQELLDVETHHLVFRPIGSTNEVSLIITRAAALKLGNEILAKFGIGNPSVFPQT